MWNENGLWHDGLYMMARHFRYISPVMHRGNITFRGEFYSKTNLYQIHFEWKKNNSYSLTLFWDGLLSITNVYQWISKYPCPFSIYYWVRSRHMKEGVTCITHWLRPCSAINRKLFQIDVRKLKPCIYLSKLTKSSILAYFYDVKTSIPPLM